MADRLFSNKHIWMTRDGEIAKLGISDYAQEKLGNIMFLNLPDVGNKIASGQRFGDIESIKTVSDLISPVDGEVVKVNDELVDEPDIINEEPYESWFVEIKIDSVSDDLMDEETYLSRKENL